MTLSSTTTASGPVPDAQRTKRIDGRRTPRGCSAQIAQGWQQPWAKFSSSGSLCSNVGQPCEGHLFSVRQLRPGGADHGLAGGRRAAALAAGQLLYGGLLEAGRPMEASG